MGKIIDTTFKKYGRLTVLAEIKKRNKATNKPYRELFCHCVCGNECFCKKEKVLKGVKRSCGCLQKESRASLGSRKMLGYGEASANERFGAYKRGAARRGLEFALTKQQFLKIVSEPCVYCGATKTEVYRSSNPRRHGEFRYTGIDRYDNSKGYTAENCVPCCTKCNRIKLDMSADDMLAQLRKIIQNEKRWHRTA